MEKILKVVVVILIIIIVFLFNRNNNLIIDNNINEQNKKALLDTLRLSQNKIGDIEYSKNILVSEKNNLKNLNNDLNNELKKEKGKVFELTKYIVSIKKEVDTIKITNTLITYPDGVKGLEWKYEKFYDSINYRKISGISKFKIDTLGLLKPLDTEIFIDEINFNIIQGLRVKGENIEMFVRSDYKGFKVKELSSVIIDPKKHPVIRKFTKKKRFGLSLYVGYGFSLSPQLGLGVTYDFIQF